MPRGTRTESDWGSERMEASQHVEDCPDQLGVSAVFIVGIWVIKNVHDTILVVESLGPQENVGQRLGGLCPDFARATEPDCFRQRRASRNSRWRNVGRDGRKGRAQSWQGRRPRITVSACDREIVRSRRHRIAVLPMAAVSGGGAV